MRKNRISWYLELAEKAAEMSEDPYVKVGSIAVRADKSIAGVSYNGAIAGVNMDWSDRDERRKYVVHSETNLLRFIKPHECPIVAVTLSPCLDCLKNLASYGVKTVYFRELYDKCDVEDLKKAANLFKMELIQWINEGNWIEMGFKPFVSFR